MSQVIRSQFEGQIHCIEASLKMENSFTCYFPKGTVKHAFEVGRSLADEILSEKRRWEKYFKSKNRTYLIIYSLVTVCN